MDMTDNPTSLLLYSSIWYSRCPIKILNDKLHFFLTTENYFNYIMAIYFIKFNHLYTLIVQNLRRAFNGTKRSG